MQNSNQSDMFNAITSWRDIIYLIGFKFEKVVWGQIKGTDQDLVLALQAMGS